MRRRPARWTHLAPRAGAAHSRSYSASCPSDDGLAFQALAASSGDRSPRDEGPQERWPSASARPAENHDSNEHAVLEVQEAGKASSPQVVNPLLHPGVESAGRSGVVALRPGRIAAVNEHLVDSLPRLNQPALAADCAVGPRGSRDEERQESRSGKGGVFCHARGGAAAMPFALRHDEKGPDQ